MPYKLFSLLLGATLPACARSSTDVVAIPTTAYSQDNQGSVARSRYGLCWRTGYWALSDSISGCDGELAPLATNSAAIALVTAAPASGGGNCSFEVTLAESQSLGPGKRALNKAAQQRIQEQVVNRLVNCGKIDGIIVTGHADRLGLRKHKEEIAVKRAGMVARFRRAKCCCSDSNHGDHHQRASWATQGNFATRKLADYLSPNRRMVIHVQGHEK